MKNNFNPQCLTYSQINMIYNARLFWRRLTIWIRIYMFSRYFNIGTAEESFGRLYLENADFGDMLQIVTSRQIANSYTQLLNQFIFELRDLISAQLAGNTESINQHVNDLYQNIEVSAAFLASTDPYFNAAEWRNLLQTYLQFTIEEANSLASDDFGKSFEIFDRLNALTNKMGDAFAQGLYNYITSDSQNPGNPPQGSQQCVTYDEMNAIYSIRMLWFDLTYWIRAYMLSVFKGIGNPNDVYARLKQLPVTYVGRLRQIFGAQHAAGDLQLLNTYIELIAALINALKEGNTDEINRLTRELYLNADARAAFLASINPFWSESEWKARLYRNLRTTIMEFTTFLAGDFAVNHDIFSTLLNQAESASDYFAQGLFHYLSQIRKKK